MLTPTYTMLSPLINYYDADMSEDDTPRATHCSDQEYAPEINDSTDEETYPYVKNKADKRQREKTVKFSYKQHTNLYYKPELTIALGYPGPTSITHKLITAAPAPKVVKPARGDIAARIARSKAVLNRPDKTAFGPEEDSNFKQTYPPSHNLGQSWAHSAWKLLPDRPHRLLAPR